ncbi:putative ribonuclease H-like domain-containing protein [Tanacetum coccineum]
MVYGNNYNRVNYNYTTNRTHPNAQRNMVPRAVLMKTGLKPFNTARTVNTAHPKSIVFSAKPMSCFSKSAQSTVRRPYQSKTVLSNKRFTQTNNTAKAKVVNTARPKAVNTARPHSAVVNAVRVNQANVVKASACWGKPQQDDTRFIDSGCSRHMTGNIAYLLDFKEFDRGYVTFRGGAHGGRISGKGTLKTDSLDFEDVYFVNELNFNLFSVSQMCDKKNYVLFTDTECLVLSPNFKLPDESQILLKIPRKDNIESMLWHRRLGHINFKNINKLVKDNLVRGLPTKHFENDQTCVACIKGKQHRASCKSKVLNPITKPLFMLHMDLFGPTFVSSLIHKKYCLVVTDRFTWVFFLTTKDETSEILKNFIKEIENLVDKKVKIIRSDNGTEFKNKVMDDFCREKGIKREYNVARTPQQNGVAERRNRTLIEVVKILGYYNTRTKEVATGTISNEYARIQEELNACTSNQKEEITQDCIVMPIWKDAIYFDSPSKDVGNGEPKSADDDQKQVEEVHPTIHTLPPPSTTPPHPITHAPPSTPRPAHNEMIEKVMNTASSYELDSPKDMFKLGASHTLETTHVEFFNEKDEPAVDLGNITNSYTVPTTPNTRIHKDHPIKNVIGDVKSSIQTRRMTKSTSEQGFLNAVYEQKTHDTLNICLYACFLSQIEPTSIAKALSNSSWVKAIQEELLQFKLQQVWKLVDLPNGKRAIGTKWGHSQEEGLGLMDIIFGSTNKELCTAFEKLMKDKILKKFNYTAVKSASTPVDLEKPLVKDGDADDVDVHLYRSMIGSLMYLTSSRPDIMFAVCACARFQVTPKISHLLAIKRIFRYLIGKPTLGLWYSRDSPFELVAYTDSDYAGATQDRKSTTGGSLVYKRFVMLEGFQTLGLKHVKRGRDTKIPQSSSPPIKVGDEAVHKELGDRMERAATTASSLEVEQDSGSGPRCQDTILGGVDAQTRFETTSKQSNDPPLSRVNTLGSGEDSMKLMELMAHCTKLSELVRKRKERYSEMKNR